MNKLIEITPTVFGVIVPESAFDFNLCKPNIIDYWKDFEGGRSGEIELLEGTTYKDWKIHGTCTLPNYDFDFEVRDDMVSLMSITRMNVFGYRDYLKDEIVDGLQHTDYTLKTAKDSFRTRIQKAINDLGLYVVNPYGEKAPKAVCIIGGMELMVRDSMTANVNRKRFEQWQSAESKTVKKILIIEKINQ